MDDLDNLSVRKEDLDNPASRFGCCKEFDRSTGVF
jgi:hypothetical protein